jgi:excisionase family DNA binding protein
MEEKLFGTKTMASRLDVRAGTLREWVAKGIVPAIKINQRTWRFSVQDVAEALKARSESEQTR